jgi:hypothetical protein
MSTFLIFALWYATIQGHFVHLHATRFTNFYVIVNNMAIAMPQSTRAPPGGDNCSWRTLFSCTRWAFRLIKSLQWCSGRHVQNKIWQNNLHLGIKMATDTWCTVSGVVSACCTVRGDRNTGPGQLTVISLWIVMEGQTIWIGDTELLTGRGVYLVVSDVSRRHRQVWSKRRKGRRALYGIIRRFVWMKHK